MKKTINHNTNNKHLRILMFGWEWPPFNSGGLGVACAGLTESLSKKGLEIFFILPEKIKVSASHFIKFIFYGGGHYGEKWSVKELLYGSNDVFAEEISSGVKIHLTFLKSLTSNLNFDLIHAHDWMSFEPALAAQKIYKKPLIVHVHSTEYDRTGGLKLNQEIYEIEKRGMMAADLVIAVSHYTKNKIVDHYGINPEKIRIIHNGLNKENYKSLNISDLKHLKGKDKLVLFVGRITLQKGPDYFLQAAKKILEINPRVKFIIVGSGDMQARLIEEAAYWRLSNKVIFTGFLRDDNLSKIYQLADVYVMPSVSEPFGITALEAAANRLPIVLSKQSGVAETMNHSLKVDFWDIDEMVNKILAVLSYNSLKKCLIEYGHKEVEKCTWDRAAEKCVNIYNELSD